MAHTVKEILKTLSEIELKRYPVSEIHELIQLLGTYASISNFLRIGTVILRSRVNCNYEEFSKVSELSYRPPKFNTTFQRASTPYSTMFYGALIPESSESTIDDARATGALEASKLIRDKSISEGEQRITFGKWRVTKDIPVFAIIHHRDYVNLNNSVKRLQEDYNKFLKNYDPQMIEKSLMISEFFAEQFAKEITPNDYDYILSGIYSERVTKMFVNGNFLAGVLYPSVRTEGKGLNVAITSGYADTCLELEVVVESVLYKKGNNVVVDNEKIAVLTNGQKEFKLEPISNPNEHIGRNLALQRLNEIPINNNFNPTL